MRQYALIFLGSELVPFKGTLQYHLHAFAIIDSRSYAYQDAPFEEAKMKITR